MVDTEEMKRMKAKQLRYKKPIVKNINLECIVQKLWDIQEECEDVRWYIDSEDGNDSLINALLGDEDEAYEFKMAFGVLCAECEEMMNDIQNEWIPECFDIFFVGINAGDDLLGWDSYEGDYFRLECTNSFVEDESRKKLKKMTKDNLIEAAMQCLNVYRAYLGLQSRYESLKIAIDMLRNKNTGVLQAVKEIDKLYEKASEQKGWFAEYSKEWRLFEEYTKKLPPEAWIS